MTQCFTRQAVAEQLTAVASGYLSLAQLRRWLTPVFVDEAFPGPVTDQDLVTRLMFLFEDESLTEREHQGNAAVLAAALTSPLSNERLVALLPMLSGRERFCAIVAKYRAAQISRTGFLSFIAESRMPNEIRDWLQHAPPERLDALCGALSARDVAKVNVLLEVA